MKQPKPRRFRWRCVLCKARDMCESPLGALAGFENHYFTRHLDKP